LMIGSTMTNRFTEFHEEKKNLSPIAGYWAYPLVSLTQSLSKVTDQINELNRSISEATKRCHYPSEHGLSRDESAAILLYTMEAGEYSFYIALNQILRDENRKRAVPWFSYLRLFDSGLRKLPTVKGCIWRGVSHDISYEYQKNDVLTWWSITSCSLAIEVVESFLNSEKNSTLFMIEAANAKNITDYTLFPTEEEVILPMETKLRVRSNAMKHGNLRVIHLVEITDGVEEVSPAMDAACITSKPSIPAKPFKLQEFAPPGTCKELYCEGRPCAKCHECRDWHFTDDQDQWDWVCNWRNWMQVDKDRWYNVADKLFTKRDGATCYHHSLRDSYYDDVCLCEKH
ncbi:unnamed protein product, partial [Adineta steineri]